MGATNRLVLFSARGMKSFSEAQRSLLEEHYDVTYVESPRPLSESRFLKILSGGRAAAITPRALPQNLSQDFWKKLPDLEIVFLPTTGMEWFPVEEVTEQGIIVKNLPGYSGQSTAEFAWGLLLALQRRIIEANRRVLSGKSGSLLGRELSGRALGVVGCGDVGRRVAHFGNAFGMKVSVYDLKKVEGFRNVSLEETLATSDVVSIHLPLAASTRGLFSEGLMALAKRGLLIVNTARPALIDFDVMMRLLDEGVIGGYAFDQGYFSRTEILKIARHPKVIAVPHVSWYTTEAIEREMSLWVKTMASYASEPKTSLFASDNRVEIY